MRQKTHCFDWDKTSCMSHSPVLLVPALILETSRQHHSITTNPVGLCTRVSQPVTGRSSTLRPCRTLSPREETGRRYSLLQHGDTEAAGCRTRVVAELGIRAGMRPASQLRLSAHCSFHEYPTHAFRDPSHLTAGLSLGQEQK